MAAAATIRVQVESALARRYPSALTPPSRMVRPVESSGIGELDERIQGGLPVGALTELVSIRGVDFNLGGRASNSITKNLRNDIPIVCRGSQFVICWTEIGQSEGILVIKLDRSFNGSP